MPGKAHGNVKNPKQYEGLRDKGMSKERAGEDRELARRLHARRQEGRGEAQEEVVAASRSVAAQPLRLAESCSDPPPA